MASSLSFIAQYPFYPIGNTTPACLTRDLPPDTPVNILLLPCGDARNILYTVFCEGKNRLRKSLDFTCCGYDPGILARNVLLFMMIIDRITTSTVWNIFFHMYIDIDSRSILVSQSQKLAGYQLVEAWRSSPYGAVIKMGTDHTLAELRRHWELYADFYHPSKLDRLQVLQQVMDNRLREEAATAPEDNVTPTRSAGNLFLHSQASPLFSELHRRYWETGTIFTNKTKLAASTHPNSTFLYSRAGEGFNVPPNMDPMIPFHYASVFGNAGNRTLTLEDLVDSAQSQFHAWCSAFQTVTTMESTSTTLIVVRFLLGDVVTVALALRDFPDNCPSGTVRGSSHSLAAPRVAPWTACPMELNEEEYAAFGAPARFDAIDTSSVSDYLGLLNLFLATAPLLTGTPSSVLYTESFALLSSSPSTEFEVTLFASLSGMAVLMDLAPVDVMSGFTTRCNTHELLITYLRSQDKDVHQQRFTWKRPSSGDPSAYTDGGSRPELSFDTHQLAKLLHSVYLGMFRIEDPLHALTVRRALDVPGRNDAATRALVQGLIVCPSRESFATFLSFVRASLRISDEQWPDVIRTFLEMRLKDHPYFDKLRDSDVHTQLYRYGLHTFPELDHVCNPSTTTISGRLSHWLRIPPLVRVFFTVPHAKFAKLEKAVVTAKLPGNIWLHCAIDQGLDRVSHLFQLVDAAYGTLVDTGTADAPNISFQEDPAGRKNGADVVLSFVVPSRVLIEPPTGTVIVSLLVRSEVHTVLFLTPVLGDEMCVFSACLEDTDYVHLLPEEPLPRPSSHHPSSPIRVARRDEVGAIGRQPPVHVELDSARMQVASLTAKLDITNAAAQAAFARGAMPSVSQCSPCTIQVVLGGRTQTLAYSLPIVGSRHKLRLARKSSYIEVVVPVAIPFLEPDGFKVNWFPVIRANASLVPWNIHRVFLDQLPVLNLASTSTAQLEKWLSGHVSWQHSLRERTPYRSRDYQHPDPLVNVKWTITAIMVQAAGLGVQGRPQRVFTLQHSVRKDTDTILFVGKIRYDVAVHTMVCDAFVLTTSAEVFPHVAHAMPLLIAQGVMPMPVHGARGATDPGHTHGSEMHAWKRLLPALAERCRATWAHGTNCEYRVVQPDGTVRWQVPRVLPEAGDRGDPLCGCGRGKDVEGMKKDRVWRMFAPFVTRIALSPLFGVSHIEQILESMDMSAPHALPEVPQPGPTAVPAIGNGLGSTRGGAVLAAVCERCKKQEVGDVKLLKCARCKTALYCSQECQKSDWKTHKLRCKK